MREAYILVAAVLGGDSNQINKIFMVCHKCHEENKTRDVTGWWEGQREGSAILLWLFRGGDRLIGAVQRQTTGRHTAHRVQAVDNLGASGMERGEARALDAGPGQECREVGRAELDSGALRLCLGTTIK